MAPRVLIIDDSENIRSTLRLTLEFQDCEVTEAKDGLEGLEQLRQNAFDVVFCDLAMPGLGGVEVIKKAREELQLTNLPIIVLSAEEREMKAKALTAGATDYVDKPFSPEKILEIVTRYAPNG